MHARDTAAVARLHGLRVPPNLPVEGVGALELRVLAGRHAELQTSGEPRAASFVIDFDAPAVQALAERLRQAHADRLPDGAEVVAFVARVMRNTLGADAEVASEVARDLEGDCTEHALITAALARAVGLPARIVWGAVLVFKDGRWQAYGHAWVQTKEAGRWMLRDSALHGETAPVYYLPVWTLEEEGPGYRLGMFSTLARLPSRLEVLGPAP